MGLPPHTPSLGKGERINAHPCEGNTRLAGRRNLLIPHAALIVSLSINKCSHISCHPRIQGQRLSVNMGFPPHTPSLGKGERINVHPCEGIPG